MLAERIPVIFDGAMGTEIQRHNISPDDFMERDGCNEILNLTRTDLVREIHTGFLEAGAHVIETNTFGGNRAKLAEYGLENKLAEINTAAAKAAREAVETFRGDHPALVCGTMGPTGYLLSSSDESVKRISFVECVALYKEQAVALLRGHVDLLLLETMQDLLEVRAAVRGIRGAFEEVGVEAPIQVQVTMDGVGHMLLGSDILAFLGAVANLRVTAMGLNCSTGPKEMAPLISRILQEAPCPVSMIPNAGMPENVDGTAVYHMEPGIFAESLSRMVVEQGVNVVGGCCGTTTAHVGELARRLSGARVGQRKMPEKPCFLSAGISGVALHRQDRPIIVGERLNTQGSRKAKELVLANNYDELKELALQQERKGCSVLDLCMAVNERDNEPETMTAVIRFLAERVNCSFCIDSTDPDVFDSAIRNCPGSVLINSINLERGAAKARRVLSLASDFGCPVIALPIDDEGMARTVERKVDLAGKLVDLACGEFGLPAHFLFVDPLVFTLATGDPEAADAAGTALNALGEIKRHCPGVRTLMGVSNVSFGLRPKARRILNNLLLHHAARAGLDMAIFNPLHLDNIEEYDRDIRLMGENLLFNRGESALAKFVEYFEERSPTRPGIARERKPGRETDAADQLRGKILERDKRGLSQVIERILVTQSPGDVLNGILLPTMREVGERMASGEMILPFVLQAAEVMKQAVGILEPHFAGGEMARKGTIVLATVFGDVHDIGKNLVGSILKNQGFRVIDLGKQVPVEEVVAAVRRERPDAVGLSALLVTTSREMRNCVEELDRQGLSVPVIVGGAAVSREFASRIARVAEGREYAGGVFYARDVFDALRILDSVKARGNSPQASAGAAVSQVSACASGGSRDSASPIVPDGDHAAVEALEHGGLLCPPFYGAGDVLTWPATKLLESIDRGRFYKGYWRGGKLDPDAYERAVVTDFDNVYDTLSHEILERGLLEARGLYAYFPVITKGEVVTFLDPKDFHTEIASFRFPRNNAGGRWCIADYFRPESDVIAVQAVTIGPKLGERSRGYLQDEEQYALGFYLNGMGSCITEFLADKVTAEIRRGLIIPRDQGKRYSFGYKGLPGLREQAAFFDLMSVEDRLGIRLTPGYQMEPEHSTIGIFAHHPKAQYR